MRYRNNDYSVPVAYAHREIIVKGYVDEVVIVSGGEEIARHRRSYEIADFVFDLARITCRCSNRRSARWIRRRLCRAGICRRSSRPCAAY